MTEEKKDRNPKVATAARPWVRTGGRGEMLALASSESYMFSMLSIFVLLHSSWSRGKKEWLLPEGSKKGP